MTKTVLNPLAAASWPIAVGGVAYGFRKPLAQLAGRIKSVSGWGASLDIAPRQDALGYQQDASEGGAVLPATIDGSQTPAADPVFSVMDQRLLNELTQTVHGDDQAKLAWAVRQRSISEANRLHEFHYRLMFGSQMKALIALNQAVQGEVRLFEQFYEQNVLADPANSGIHQGRTFAQWGQFLVGTGYVEIVAGTDPEVVRITPFGRQFCAWLGYAGASQLKPG